MLLIIQHIENYNNSLNHMFDRMPITISAEFESPRSDPRLLALLPYVDIAFVAKEFAEYLGLSSMSEVMHNIGQDVK